MRIPGSPGSYGSIWECDPWDARTKLNLLRCSGHMQTGGVRVFYWFSTGSLRCFGKWVARTRTVHVRVRTVHVRAPYGPIRTWEHPYDHCTWPVRVRWWPRVYIRVLGPVRLPTCLLRVQKEDVHAQLSNTGCLRGIQGLYGLKKTRRTPCRPVQYAVRSPTGHWNFGPCGAPGRCP